MRTPRWTRILRLVLVAASVAATAWGQAPARPMLRIGVAIDGPWLRNDELSGLFVTEITELLARDYQVLFPEDRTLVGDWSLESVRSAVTELLADPSIDLVLGLGVLASHELSSRGPLPRPAIAPYVLDIELQGLPLTDKGSSGVENLNYLTAAPDSERQLTVFREILPYDKLALLLSPHYAAVTAGHIDRMDALGRRLGFEIVRVPVGESVDEALEALPEDVDAVYVAPLLHLPAGEMEKLAVGLIERRLPSLALLGVTDVEAGLLAGLTQESEFRRTARRVALNIQRILRGEDAGSLSVQFAVREQLTINMTTARAIGTYPRWEILTEAVLIKEKREDIERKLTLEDVVQEALRVNPDLRAQERATAAGEQDVRSARSVLLPQLDLASTARVIDADRAEAGFGSAPQRNLDASLALSQVIYSEPARANLGIQTELQTGREAEERSVRLDIVQQAAKAYLDVLRTKNLEAIRKENLKVTRSNLELARIRRTVGVAGPGEVYRWESKIATDRGSVIEASALRNLAEIQVNRLLSRPGEEAFETVEVKPGDVSFMAGHERVVPYIDNPWGFDIFRDFMVEEAWAASPDLKQLDAAIAAQERALVAARRRFWVPEVALLADVRQNLSRGGAGTGAPVGPPEFPLEFPQADDTDWSLGVAATFDLVTSGAKGAARAKAVEELERLRFERQALADGVEQRTRSTLHLAGAAYANIDLSRKAAEASLKNLDVVQDSYSQGLLSVLDLLDAQNSALVSNLVAANAVYDYASDVVDVERAVGRFDIFSSTAEREAFFERLEAWAARVREDAR